MAVICERHDLFFQRALVHEVSFILAFKVVPGMTKVERAGKVSAETWFLLLGELPLLEFQEGGSYLFVEQAHVDVVFGQRKFKIAHNKVVSILSVLEIFDFVMLYLLETTAVQVF